MTLWPTVANFEGSGLQLETFEEGSKRFETRAFHLISKARFNNSETVSMYETDVGQL